MATFSLNVNTTQHTNTVTDIRIAAEAGFDGIEFQSAKLDRYLAAGYSAASLVPLLGPVAVSGVGAVLDIERRGAGRDAFLAEVDRMSGIASALGSSLVELCTGPVDWNTVRDFTAGTLRDDDERYRGTLGLDEAEAVRIVADNVRDAADVAASHGVGVYIEPLAWSNVNRHRHALAIIEKADRPNIGLALDVWHYWTTGDTLEEVAATPKELIKAVHISDGLDLDRGRTVPDQSVHRNVMIGGGAIPLQEWVDAVKATGYDDWWVAEMFSDKADEHDPLEVARTVLGLMKILVS